MSKIEPPDAVAMLTAARDDGASVFERMAMAIKLDLNDVIAASEKPDDALGRLLELMAEILLAGEDDARTAKVAENDLAIFAKSESADAAEWKRRAMIAVRAGDDSLAKAALKRRRKHADGAEQYGRRSLKQKRELETLKEALRVLNHKMEDCKRKRQILNLRSPNRARKKVDGAQPAFEAFERMEATLEKREAEQLRAWLTDCDPELVVGYRTRERALEVRADGSMTLVENGEILPELRWRGRTDTAAELFALLLRASVPETSYGRHPDEDHAPTLWVTRGDVYRRIVLSSRALDAAPHLRIPQQFLQRLCDELRTKMGPE